MSDLAAEKKRAEVEADEAMGRLWEAAENYFDTGKLSRDVFEVILLLAKVSHNTERGLRHEKD